jgi:hypothetical protein
MCDNRELWPDRSTDEHPVWSKTCSSHQDIRHKKPIQKFNHLPTYFGGESQKWGAGMEKCANKALMLEFLDRCGRNLDHCVAPT